MSDPSPADHRYRVFEHADGGYYVRVEETMDNEMKMDDGTWQPAVHYRPVTKLEPKGFCFVNRKQYTTTLARWQERFREIER